MILLSHWIYNMTSNFKSLKNDKMYIKTNDELEDIINKIVNTYNPYSIFLYWSKATLSANINSDYELWIIFEDDKYISRHTIANLINNKGYSIFPFKLSEILNYNIDTPFPKTIYMNVLIHWGAKTLYGKKVIENIEPRIINKEDLLADVYFNLWVWLSAIRVYKSGNITLANDMFYKSCFYATRDLIYYLDKKLCISYKEIYETSQKIEVLKNYKEIVNNAYYLRNNPNGEIDSQFFYNNITYINKFILQIIER